MNLTRRKFFLGLGIAAAAPAIVRVASIMPIRDPLMYLSDTSQNYLIAWGPSSIMQFNYNPSQDVFAWTQVT